MKPSAQAPSSLAIQDVSLVLGWLADAPLYLNAELLESFYDAVVKPENKEGKTVLEIASEEGKRSKMSAGVDIGGELSAGDLLTKIANLFPSIKLSGKASGGIEREATGKDTEKSTVELFPIDNPQRQLVHLTISYLIKHPQRLLLVDNPSEEGWRDAAAILASPRQLVFLDLPSQTQAAAKSIPEVKLIPTAAEFLNGKIEPLFTKFQQNGGEQVPSYPELHQKDQAEQPIATLEHLLQARKAYWQWFEQGYSSKQARAIVEAAATDNGKMRWIDYRMPIAYDGSTLHLHFSGVEKYSTGDFAYNLISRGLKHGLRVVGTLKSEPALNVLAVFEK